MKSWKQRLTGSIDVPDDLGEAQEMRDEAAQDLQALKRQAPAIARMTGYLNGRRDTNHFGESIQITYVRRGHA